MIIKRPSSGVTNQRLSRLYGILGFGSYWTWLYIALYSDTITNNSVVTREFYLFSIAGAVLMYLVCAFFKLNQKFSSHIGSIGSFSLAASTLLSIVGVSIQEAQPYLFPLASLATGLSSALLLLSWGKIHSNFDPKRVAVDTAFSTVIAAAIFLFLQGLRDQIGLPILAAQTICILLPVLSFICMHALTNEHKGETAFRAHYRDLPKPETQSTTKVPAAKLPIALMLSISLYGIAFGLINSIVAIQNIPGGTFASPLALLSGGIVAAIIGIGALLLMDEFDFGFAYRPVLLLVAAGFCILPILSPEQGYIAASIATAGYICFDILIWVTLVQAASRAKQRALPTLALGRLACSGSVMVGSILGSYIASTISISPTQLTTLSLSIVYLFILFGVVSLDKQSFPRILGFSKKAESTEDTNREFKEKCIALSQEKGLSSRETEILVLLAQGRSIPYIADNLFIAESTARTHAKHIYRKLNVHSRNELLDLVTD